VRVRRQAQAGLVGKLRQQQAAHAAAAQQLSVRKSLGKMHGLNGQPDYSVK
jgi:hypothetical protein